MAGFKPLGWCGFGLVLLSRAFRGCWGLMHSAANDLGQTDNAVAGAPPKMRAPSVHRPVHPGMTPTSPPRCPANTGAGAARVPNLQALLNPAAGVRAIKG
jgi:hypothetical protein